MFTIKNTLQHWALNHSAIHWICSIIRRCAEQQMLAKRDPAQSLLPLLPPLLLVVSVGIGVTSSILPILRPLRARALMADWAPGPIDLEEWPPLPLSLMCTALMPTSVSALHTSTAASIANKNILSIKYYTKTRRLLPEASAHLQASSRRSASHALYPGAAHIHLHVRQGWHMQLSLIAWGFEFLSSWSKKGLDLRVVTKMKMKIRGVCRDMRKALTTVDAYKTHGRPQGTDAGSW